MARGASASSAPLLFFVHADCRLPAPARRALRDWVRSEDSASEAAYFRFALNTQSAGARAIETVQRLRERLLGVVYGDQGLLVSRALYERSGGYPEIPLFEDVAIVRALRRVARVRRLDADLLTSYRRYERDGWIAGPLRNGCLALAYSAGVPAERLARWYASEPARSSSQQATSHQATNQEFGTGALVFAKAPVPGSVKTRLAADVGADAAAAFYARVARGVVDDLRGQRSLATVVCFAPAGAEAEVRAWLGSDRLRFRPQCEGDLGTRMAEAIEWGLGHWSRVCVIGTDAPDVSGAVVCEAAAALDSADVVLGPALDGGYYLIALKRNRPELFTDIAWSTETVLAETRSRCQALGLTVTELAVRSDIDRLQDVPDELRALFESSET